MSKMWTVKSKCSLESAHIATVQKSAATDKTEVYIKHYQNLFNVLNNEYLINRGLVQQHMGL